MNPARGDFFGGKASPIAPREAINAVPASNALDVAVIGGGPGGLGAAGLLTRSGLRTRLFERRPSAAMVEQC